MTDDLFAFKPDRAIRTGSEQNDNDGDDDDDDDDDDERQERIFMRKLIIPCHRKFDDIHFVSVAQTSNCALIALLCYQSRFSGRLNNFKSQNTILYLGTIATPQTMIDRLRWKILQPLRTIEESDNNRTDLADLLFWFRWSLLTKDFSQLKSIITILLRKVPIWICKHSGEAIVNTFECLFRLKAFRVLSKYCLQESEQSLIDENDLIRLKKLIKKLNFLILRNVFQRIFKSPMFDDYEKLQSADDEWLLRFSIEQLLSIWNLNKTGIIDHFSNDQMERLSSLLHSTTKISWPRFQSAQFYLNEMKLEPFSLPLIEYNLRCPLCLMKIDEDLDKLYETLSQFAKEILFGNKMTSMSTPPATSATFSNPEMVSKIWFYIAIGLGTALSSMILIAVFITIVCYCCAGNRDSYITQSSSRRKSKKRSNR
ncbi:hypothetical protein QR98_0002600 [Sarcoptes scabiei]|uniref:Uncharacterized protein n=1 Tax=Sarcoptes scabiei TaxID=52283 RepID=A0A131ZTP6_SARSC|nr:hypothetical protein QR98_0002600 [Sarcoptes scabiei]